MKTRRKFITGTTSTLTAATLGKSAEKDSPLLSFGLMADCQYADADTRGTRFYRESPRKLKEAVTELNRHPLEFSFHLGDFIDRDFASFETLDPIISQLDSTIYHALGNHDFDVEDHLKAKVPAKLGLEKGYYSFIREGFRFVVIDTTDVSTYRFPAGTDADRVAEEELKKLQEAKVPGSKPWNGRPGSDQLTWLKAEFQKATDRKETVLVFGHHPILPNESHAIWNSGDLNQLFQKYPCVKLYMNGHNHAGHHVDEKGLHYLTLNGMLETKDSNAFGIGKLHRDRLEITGFGRQKSRNLAFRT